MADQAKAPRQFAVSLCWLSTFVGRIAELV